MGSGFAKGLGTDGYVRTVNKLTVRELLRLPSNIRYEFGDGGQAALLYERADADASYPILDLEAGGAVHVPVLALGVDLDGVDLGMFDGITQPMLATIDADRDSYVGFHYSADDVAVIRMRLGSAGTVRNHTLPDVPSDTLLTRTTPDDVRIIVGTDGDGSTLLRSTILAANTALTDVLLGTPVTPALPANSLIISNITASGDILLATNKGGNSIGGLWLDGSTGDAAILAASGQSVDVYIAGTKEIDYATGAMAFQQATTISTTAGNLTLDPAGNLDANSNTFINVANIKLNASGSLGRDVSNDLLLISGGDGWSNGAYIQIYGQAHGSLPGAFDISTTTASAGNATARLRVTGDVTTAIAQWTNVYHTGLKLGLAGTATGAMTIDGATSGVVTMTVAAAAGTWTLTLPPDNGDAGEQLQTDGSGVTTWEAAGSLSRFKNVRGVLDPDDAYRAILGVETKLFTYRPRAADGTRATTTGDFETMYAGVLGDDAPWAMHHNGRIFSPINAFGYTVAALHAVDKRFSTVEERFAAVEDAEAILRRENAELRGEVERLRKLVEV